MAARIDGRVTVALGGVAAAALIAAAFYVARTPSEDAESAALPVAEQPSAVPADPPAEPVEDAQTAAPVAEESAAADPPGDQDTAPPAVPPSFDIVRVEADGATLIAGLAQAGAKVAILVDGSEKGAVEADASGRFVSFLDIPQSADPRIVSLLMTPGTGGDPIASDQTVILAPSQAAPSQTVAADPAPDAPEPVAEELAALAPAAESAGSEPPEATPSATPQEAAETPAPAADATEPVATPAATAEPAETPAEPAVDTPATPAETAADTLATPAEPSAPADAAQPAAAPEADTAAPDTAETLPPEDTAPQDPAAPTVLLADDDGVRVLQAPQAPPEVMANVALDTITYDAQGDVQLAGRAIGAGSVRVYLDNAPITSSRISEGGNWQVDLPEIDTGVYTLRVDELDAAGEVVSRIETPFQREDEAVVAAVQAAQSDRVRAQGGSVVTLRTVQPGATLWAIARDKYGSGFQYVKVFEANRDRIRDPDLIYPGQVFIVPD